MKPNFVDFSQLKDSEIAGLVLALKNDAFDIISYTPNKENHPEGLLDIFTTNVLYSYLLDDKSASFVYFSIRFKLPSAETIDLPVGVFGVGSSLKVHYPFIASGYLRNFLDLSKADFKNLVELDDDMYDIAYEKILKVRAKLLEKIFVFYSNYSTENNSLIAWKLRNKESLTRKTAQVILSRIENEEADVEFYYSKPIESREVEYLKQCYSRWEKLGKEFNTVSTLTPKHSNESENMNNFSIVFYNELIASPISIF